MAWCLLLAAGAVEIVMALALKRSEGWTRLGPSALGIAAALLSIYLLALAAKQLPAGTAYAVWTGIGLVGSVVLGIALFGDSASPMRIGCLALVVLGMVGLRWLDA